jgi:regulator of nucleoside diphosphate kinase
MTLQTDTAPHLCDPLQSFVRARRDGGFKQTVLKGKRMSKKPNIILSSLDLERLEALLDALAPNAFPIKEALLEELGRAEVMEPGQIPPTVVTMNSTVRFAMASSNEEFCKTLVYPKDMAGSEDRISVLAPVGSALLGLSTGDQMEWPRPGGGVVTVKIMDIVYQPEKAGEFHR